MSTKLDNLLKLLEPAIEKMVERKIKKVLPKILKSELNSKYKRENIANLKKNKNASLKKENITESLKALVGDDMGEWRSINYNTGTGVPTQPNFQPPTDMGGRVVNTSDPNVQGVLGAIMSPDLGKKFKMIDEKSKQRNGRI